jgi:hypothetical protein
MFPRTRSPPSSKVQETAGFSGEVRIARKNPAAVLPRPDGVLVQPAPDGRIADAGYQSGGNSMAGDLGHAPARQGHFLLTGQLARQGFNLHHDFRGGKTGDGPVGGVPPSPPGVR